MLNHKFDFSTKLAQRSTQFIVGCMSLWAVSAYSAPQTDIPGFYLTTLGATLEDVQQKTYTPDGYFIGLQKGVAIAFAKNVDVAFVVEKEGLVRVLVDGVLQERPVIDMSDQTSTWIDRGLGGIAVHPDFPTVKEILITYTHENGVTAYEGTKYAKVAKLTLREEVDATGKISYFGDAPTDNDVIIGKLSATTEFPSCNDRPLGSDCGAVDDGSHSFTFVTYGPDGYIYIGTGDGAGFYSTDVRAFYALVDEHLAGKVLRVDSNGAGLTDNPFYTGNPQDNASKVFAKGLRNPKSGSFNPDTGKFCVGNVGWYSNEGVYCLNSGDNAGWPCQENGVVYNGYQTLALNRDGVRLASCPLAPGSYISPSFSYAHVPQDVGGEIVPVGAVIGCATATASEYPDSFKGTCFYGDYVFDTISSVRLAAGGGNPSTTKVLSGAGLPVDVATDREGRICYLAYTIGTVDGRPVTEIRCLGYDDDGTVPQYPVAAFNGSPDATNTFKMSFDASASYHTSGAPISYHWDFGDGTSGNGLITDHIYSEPGDFTVTLTVTTIGESVSRDTFQLVRIEDPDLVKPIQPSITKVEFDATEHFLSGEVKFDIHIRNDKGNDPFNILANIYDENNIEVGHLVNTDLHVIPAGTSKVISFNWNSTTELGDHNIWIEFYAEDWSSWTIKYSNTAQFFVRNRVSGEIPGPVEVDDECSYIDHGQGDVKNGVWGLNQTTSNGCWLTAPNMSICGTPDANSNFWCPDGKQYTSEGVLVGGTTTDGTGTDGSETDGGTVDPNLDVTTESEDKGFLGLGAMGWWWLLTGIVLLIRRQSRHN